MYSGMPRLCLPCQVPSRNQPAVLVPVVEEGQERGGGGGIHLRGAMLVAAATQHVEHLHRIEHAAPLAGEAARAVGAAEHEVHDGALARDLPAEPFVGHEQFEDAIDHVVVGGLDARVPRAGGVVLARLQPPLHEVDHGVPRLRAVPGRRRAGAGAARVQSRSARGCRGPQGEMGLHGPGRPASGGPRRVRGPGLRQPAARLIDRGEAVAVGLRAGGQPVAVGHEHPVAQLPLESR